MNKLHRLLTLGATLGLAVALSAQPGNGTRPHGPGGPGGRGGPHGPGRGHPIVRVLDADHDGVISAAELAGASAAIRTLDADGDGAVSADELRPPRPVDAPPPPANDTNHPRPADPIMLALDANLDGALSAAEIANAPASLAALDANKDGQLTPDEYRPLPPGPPPQE